jgi:excisionase family DNA binding protein
MTKSDQNYIDIKLVAEHFGMSVSSIRNLIRKNEIPYIKIGNVYRFNLEEIKNSFKDKSSKTLDKKTELALQKIHSDASLVSPLSRKLFLSYNFLWNRPEAREMLEDNLISLGKKDEFLVRLFTGVPRHMTLEDIARFTGMDKDDVVKRIDALANRLMHPSRFNDLNIMFEEEWEKRTKS